MTSRLAPLLALLLSCCFAASSGAETFGAPWGSNLEIGFAANTGQLDRETCYRSLTPGPVAKFTEDAVILARDLADGLPPVLVRVSFPGGHPSFVEARHPLPGVANYYLGDDPARWRTNVPTHARIAYVETWPGIDVVWSGRGGRLKSDFIVSVGGDPDDIRLRYEGTRGLSLGAGGELLLHTVGGDLIERPPVAWQEGPLGREPVACRFLITPEGNVAFGLGSWDPARELVIDPVLDFSSFLGGSGSDAAVGVAVDGASRESVITGTTTSVDFPTFLARQPTHAGGKDLFALRLDAAGDRILWATYIGGAGDDEALGSSPSGGGGAWIVGRTNSADFPAVHRAGPRGGPSDAFAVSVNRNGSLFTSGVAGGSDADEAHAGTTASLVGTTRSADFPMHGDSFDRSLGGGQDAFLLVFGSTGGEYSTFLGGSGVEEGLAVSGFFGIGVGQDVVRVGGRTESTDFPTSGFSFDDTLDGPSDGFLVSIRAQRLPSPVHDFLSGTYFGGSGADAVTVISRGADSRSHVAGWTSSDDFPVKLPYQSSRAGGRDGFLAIVGGSTMVPIYSTYLGGSGDDEITSLLVDQAENNWVGGVTDSSDFPLVDPVQGSLAGGTDAFLAELQPRPRGMVLLESTYFGGSENEGANSISLDSAGCRLLAGSTNSTDLPLVNAAQPFFAGGDSEAFVARICERPTDADGGVDFTELFRRLDELRDKVDAEEAKLDAVEVKLDTPPSHADLQALIEQNGLSIAAVETKLDMPSDHEELERKIDALEVKADSTEGKVDALEAKADAAEADRDEARKREIERMLHHKECIPSLWLPASEGGDLELAAAHVADLIARAERSGDPHANVPVARQRLADAAAAAADGEYGRACQKLSDALRALSSP